MGTVLTKDSARTVFKAGATPTSADFSNLIASLERQSYAGSAITTINSGATGIVEIESSASATAKTIAQVLGSALSIADVSASSIRAADISATSINLASTAAAIRVNASAISATRVTGTSAMGNPLGTKFAGSSMSITSTAQADTIVSLGTAVASVANVGTLSANTINAPGIAKAGFTVSGAGLPTCAAGDSGLSAVFANYGVSSVTRFAIGHWRVRFKNPFSNVHYQAHIDATRDPASPIPIISNYGTAARTVSAFEFQLKNTTSAAANANIISVTVFGSTA